MVPCRPVGALLGSLLLAASPCLGQQVESLPAPVVNNHSFELLSNTRRSVHSGFTDSLPRQVLANVLWGMEAVPRFGAHRELYVATRDNVYRYDRSTRTLTGHLAGDHRYRTTAAFEVGVAAPRHEEAGICVQAGLLAGIAFNEVGGPGVAACPMRWATDHANANWDPDHEILMTIVFGRATVPGPDTSLIAISSDSSLPPPYTSGPDSFEIVVMGLCQDSVFDRHNLSLETISQILWAGYGPNPHTVLGGRRGLTVPSAVAAYHLTGAIYLVREEGVDRYHNRLPGGSLATADHRLERILTGDRREGLRAASARLPQIAPCYIVLCVRDTSAYGPMQEAGFAGFQYLAQAGAIGLGGHLLTGLTRAECQGIAAALELPAEHMPALVFSVGAVMTGVDQTEQPALVEVTRAPAFIRRGEGLRVDFLLRQAGLVRVEVFDLLGRPVSKVDRLVLPAGYHSVEWDGHDDDGRVVEPGPYVIGIFAPRSWTDIPGSVAQHKVTVF